MKGVRGNDVTKKYVSLQKNKHTKRMLGAKKDTCSGPIVTCDDNIIKKWPWSKRALCVKNELVGV